VFAPTSCRELLAKDRLDDAIAHSRSRSARIGELDARIVSMIADIRVPSAIPECSVSIVVHDRMSRTV